MVDLTEIGIRLDRPKRRPRDSKRQKTYDWEIMWAWCPDSVNSWDKEEPRLTMAQCQEIVDSVWTDYKLGDDPPTVKSSYGRHSWGGEDTIRLNITSRFIEMVLHEVTHSIQIAHSTGDAWHGPIFMRIYINLLKDYANGNETHLVSSAITCGLDVAGIDEAPRRVLK